MRAASAEYAAEFNEVKLLGSNANPNPRSDAQTLLAQFYSANPMPILNRAFRGIAADRGLSTLEQARLFAMMSMAGADSLIGCWDDKDHWNFWRPLTAIREAADDGNDATERIPTGGPSSARRHIPTTRQATTATRPG